MIRLCKSAGIRSASRRYPATFLGSSEVTLSELALGYTIFPNGGWRPSTPHILERIEEKDGTVVGMRSARKSRESVTKPETAYEVHSCLEDALEVGTGKTSHTEFGLKKIRSRRKNRNGLRFHGRVIRRLRSFSDLRSLGWL